MSEKQLTDKNQDPLAKVYLFLLEIKQQQDQAKGGQHERG